MRHLKLQILGKVQGVYFRAEVKNLAESLGLRGYAQNQEDGSLIVVAEGTNEDLSILKDWCKHGPDLAEVEELKEEWTDEFKDYPDFSIRL